MRTAMVVVDSHLRVDGNVLGRDLVDDILDELTIANAAKAVAKRTKRYGWWDLPDEFLLGDLDGDELIMPRGYAVQLKRLCREYDIKVIWVDRRKGQKGKSFKWRKNFTARPHQPLAVRKMRRHQQGMYQAPTGSGKSLTCIKFVHDVAPAQSIVLVDQVGLQTQWIKEFGNWLGGENVGQIGNGVWVDDKRVTVATVQTIWSKIKRGELPEDFFDRYDCVIVDECHHVSAETIEYIVGMFRAKWRIGVSATPDRLDHKFAIVRAVLGEVFHQDDEDRLRKLGVLVKPQVQVIKTDFEFEYVTDHESDRQGRCRKRGCTIHRQHGHRNNYQKLKDAIVSNVDRNELVGRTVSEQAVTGPHHHLIVSDEIRHLEAIEQTSWIQALQGSLWEIPVFVLTGKVSGNKRQALIEEIAAAEQCIVLATVAKEGLDIPRIDRIYLPFPSSNPKKVQQWVGRGTRSAAGKTDVLIFDFLDILVGILKKQFRSRRYGFYDKNGIEVVK